MPRRAHVNVLSGIVLADSLFGTVTEIRQPSVAKGWSYCVGIESNLKVIAADTNLGSVPKYRGRRQPAKPLNGRAKLKITVSSRATPAEGLRHRDCPCAACQPCRTADSTAVRLAI
jgi:hypothetical protein